ncbi:hypothetical protein DL95DRAFT_379282 [Leptodontidium sp. 2 PMI_412]|nr:hypothetical protein DL95DRAFT_379282 [Leptodontidium sp. 2 PMI_412]
MRELEGRIESDLRGVEDVLWPRRIIKFDSLPSSPGGGRVSLVDEESPYWVVRAWIWVCELPEEIWEDGGEIARGIIARLWGSMRNLNVPLWTVGLVVGLVFVYLYILLSHQWRGIV